MSDSASILPESKPAIIIPCHNRKATTLGCLERLKQIGVFPGFHILVVDDGSTDGTAEAIAREFPEVEVLQGSGDLYWTGAMELGMRHAHTAGASSFIWINDDTEVAAGAIEAITARAEETGGIVSGLGQVIVEAQDYSWYFPACYRGPSGLLVKEIDRTLDEIEVDTCRGNLVAISRKVVNLIGFPDGRRIPHFGGDTDYGLRASRAGLSVKILPRALVREIGLERTDNQSWLLGDTGVLRLWRNVFQKRNAFYPPMIFAYNYRHWGARGLIAAIRLYLKLAGISLLRILIPRSLRIRWFGRHSHAWKTLAPMRKDAAT